MSDFSRMLEHFTVSRTVPSSFDEVASLEIEGAGAGAGAESLGKGLEPITPTTPWYYYAGGAAAVLAVLWLLKGKRGRR